MSGVKNVKRYPLEKDTFTKTRPLETNRKGATKIKTIIQKRAKPHVPKF